MDLSVRVLSTKYHDQGVLFVVSDQVGSANWPAPGSEDTKLGSFLELEVVNTPLGAVMIERSNAINDTVQMQRGQSRPDESCQIFWHKLRKPPTDAPLCRAFGRLPPCRRPDYD